jgi:hypothetical protein
LEGAVNDAIKWLDASQEGSKEEYEEKQKELEAIARYVFLFFPCDLILLLIYGLSLALSCKNSIALQVVHRVVVVLEGSLEVASLAVDSLAVVLVLLLVVSLVQTRKVPAWRRSTKTLFSPFPCMASLSFDIHLTSPVEK